MNYMDNNNILDILDMLQIQMGESDLERLPYLVEEFVIELGRQQLVVEQQQRVLRLLLQ
jgi:hypothetical protein